MLKLKREKGLIYGDKMLIKKELYSNGGIAHVKIYSTSCSHLNNYKII